MILGEKTGEQQPVPVLVGGQLFEVAQVLRPRFITQIPQCSPPGAKPIAEQALLPSLGVGQALWKIAGRSFLSQHQLHPAELQAFDTRQKMLEKT